jgi:sulfate/thiosulfate transport system permease protein
MSAAGTALGAGGARRRILRGALLAISIAYVAVLLLAPVGAIAWTVLRAGGGLISNTFAQPDVRHAFFLTAVITVITVFVTGVLGVVTSWVLTRDRFPGRGLLNGLVDLPMAISPVIVGLMAVLMFGTGGWFEPFFAARGIQIIFALPSMVIVTIFICIPFVIREVVPVLEEIGVDEEEAAKTLGASALQSFFRVTLPGIRWGLLYGVGLSTARAMGEIGAVLIVSGGLQGQTETATLYIFRALEERQDAAGYVVALTLAATSILLLVAIEAFKGKREKETPA